MTHSSAEYDVVVAGAGPAGSASAALLARAGFKVLVLDRASFPRDKACGEYTSPDTEALLARLGALDAVLAAGGRRLGSMRVVGPSGRSFEMDYTGASDGGRQVLATTRRVLDAVLVDHARRQGAEVRERVKVEAVLVENGQAVGVATSDRGGDRSTYEVRARLVIGADGKQSATARNLGLQAPLRWPRSLGMVAHYRGYSGLDDWGEMHVSSAGYAGLAPQSDGIVNVGLVMPMKRAEDYAGLSAAERFERFAFSFPGVADRLRGAERVTSVRGAGPIGARVRRAYGPGFLLVGDAAGFFDPFTGEGVHKALRGAELAAQVAAKALEKNDLSEQALSKYGTLRSRAFATKEVVCRMVQLFVAAPPAMDYVVTRLAQRERPRTVMTGVLGDLADPRSALSPLHLWNLLRP